ncbi:MAG: hypothetical protein CL916_00230 [Deltaproteobacteria bacterium]|nr:hypothetical protein [Deltaproteobacteria bacterium]
MNTTRIPLFLLRSLQIFLFVGFGLYAFAFVIHSFEVITYPWSVDYVEAPELNRAVRIAQGKEIYPSWEVSPFLESNYTPFFSLLNSLLIDAMQPTYWQGRLLNVILTVGTAGLIARIVFVQTAVVWQGLLGAMIYCSSHVIWMWGSLLRVDTLAVFFNVLALWLFLEPSWKKTKSNMTIIAILCLSAAFTRQTMIASFVSILFITIWKHRDLSLRLIFTYLVCGIVGLLCLSFWSGGHAYMHLVEANINEFLWSNTLFFFTTMWDLYHAFIPAIVLGIWSVWRERPVLILYTTCALIVSMTVGKIGASLNYLMELWVAISILVAIGMGSVKLSGNRGLWISIGVCFAGLIGWQQCLHIPWYRAPKPNGGFTAKSSDGWETFMSWTSKLPFSFLDPFALHGDKLLSRSVRVFTSYRGDWERDAMHNIERNLPSFPGPILSEDMNFTVTSGRDIWIQPFEFSQFSNQGLWSDTPLIDAIEKQNFALLILLFDLNVNVSLTPSGDRFTPKIRNTMKEKYELISREGMYWIYTPITVP